MDEIIHSFISLFRNPTPYNKFASCIIIILMLKIVEKLSNVISLGTPQWEFEDILLLPVSLLLIFWLSNTQFIQSIIERDSIFVWLVNIIYVFMANIIPIIAVLFICIRLITVLNTFSGHIASVYYDG